MRRSIRFAAGLVALTIAPACTSPQPAPDEDARRVAQSSGAPAPPVAVGVDSDTAKEEARRPAQPGFALYTEHRTILLPFDGAGPFVSRGVWILDDGVKPPHIERLSLIQNGEDADGPLPPCPCAEVEGACHSGSLEATPFDADTRSARAEPTCRCLSAPENAMPPPPREETVDDIQYEPCAPQSEFEGVSIVAGRLFDLGWDWNQACFGALSVYDSAAWDTMLVEHVPHLDLERGMRRYGCTLDFPPASVVRPWPLPRSEYPWHDDFCYWEDSSWVEAETAVLRRGYLWWIGETIGHAGGTRWVKRRRLSPDDCPGPNEPCGDVGPFREHADFSTAREWWVSTSGAGALTARGESYQLWNRAGDAPIAFELRGIDASHDVIGIREHADLADLIATTAHYERTHPRRRGPPPTLEECRMPEAFETDRGFVNERGGRQWSSKCFEHLRNERLTSAEAACRRGLEIATDPEVIGVLAYNWGRTVEARGAWREALDLYERSLAARPDNKPTQRRVASLRARQEAAARPPD